VPVEEFMELNMGKWEGLTTDEIAERWPGHLEMIYRDGKDLPRGETGQTWRQLAERFAAGLDELEHDQREPTVVVAHGGAIRAYVSSLTNTTDTHAESLYTPRNTAVTHIAYTDDGPLILDYAVATHLEGME
jgi:broad specificity phosphatase PhoE